MPRGRPAYLPAQEDVTNTVGYILSPIVKLNV